MAGYASQTDYEADLLQTYLRKGRVSPVAKRDVDLALSIYKMPKAKTSYAKQAKLDYKSAKAAAKGKDDKTVMRMSTIAVLNKHLDTKKQTAAAKAATAKQQAAARSMASGTASRTAAPRPAAAAVPPRTAYRPAQTVSRPVSRTPTRTTYVQPTTATRRVAAPTSSTAGTRTYTPPRPRTTTRRTSRSSGYTIR